MSSFYIMSNLLPFSPSHEQSLFSPLFFIYSSSFFNFMLTKAKSKISTIKADISFSAQFLIVLRQFKYNLSKIKIHSLPLNIILELKTHVNIVFFITENDSTKYLVTQAGNFPIIFCTQFLHNSIFKIIYMLRTSGQDSGVCYV